jgi:hypothetical protein
MVGAMMLAASLAVLDPSASHVRSSEPEIVALIQAGVERSATFRRLVEALDRSDVIVYIKLKVARQALGGYLAHNVLNGGSYRYLRVAISVRGSNVRAIAVLAHELQHALEVAGDSEARDPARVERLFARLAMGQACGVGNCFETKAAMDVEAAVQEEVSRARR